MLSPDDLPAALSAIIERWRSLPADEKRRSAPALVRDLVRRVHQSHQFAAIERGRFQKLERAVLELVDDRIEPRAVAEIARELVPAAEPAVVSADYEPELQLTLLGLDVESLAEPVLDLGCGYEARLVQALRARGIDAVGLDRYLAPGAGIEADFVEHPLTPASFGTIVSHQAFSLHFIHQHLKSESGAARYAQRMLEILRALKPGGVLAYAPGLPFFEPVLERAGMQVTRVDLPPGLAERVPRALAERVGADVAYACRIKPR